MSEPEMLKIPADAPRGMYGPDGQPQFFQDAAMDRFVAVVLKLTQELWVMSERVDMLERLAAVSQPDAKRQVDAFLNDRAVSDARDAKSAEFIYRVLGPLREPG